MSKQIEDLSEWIMEKLLKPKREMKLISNEDPYVLSHKIASVLRKQIDEPLVNIFSEIGSLALSGVVTRLNDNEEWSVLKVKLGNQLLKTLEENDKVLFSNKRDHNGWNGKISTHPWRISIGNKGINITLPKGHVDGYILEVVDKEWLNGLLESYDYELAENPIYTEPQFDNIKPYTGFYHDIGGPMVRRCSIGTKIRLDKGHYSKFRDILNNRMNIRYTADQYIAEIYNQCWENGYDLFTLADKNMSSKQKVSVLRERRFTINEAIKCGDREFSYYHFYDNRVGRIYTSANYFKPDGSKVSKSMIRLANKKAIGKEGMFWLKVHTANSWGEDKLSIDKRYEYVEQRLDEYLVCASDPVNNKLWMEADDPFGFLAAIVELYRAYQLDNPYEYESGLIIAFDATCSGLQVLSAITKDEISGKMCNVFGSELGDFYKTIANDAWKHFRYTDKDEVVYRNVIKKLKNIDKIIDFRNAVKDLGDDVMTAGKVFWAKKFDERRKISKRPCMTYFYSCKKETMAEALYKDWRTEKGYEDLNPAFCIILSDILYNSCRKIMRRPTKVMDTIIEMANTDKENGRQLWVRAPYTGIIFEQSYYKDKPTKAVWVDSCKNPVGRFRLKCWVGKSDTINYHKVNTASAPNVVHMLDSQIVAGIIDFCEYDVSCIHDSFGCVAADAGKLYEDTRSIFYSIFSQPILENILKEKEYEHLIDKLEFGNGDLNDIFNNEYCFS